MEFPMQYKKLKVLRYNLKGLCGVTTILWWNSVKLNFSNSLKLLGTNWLNKTR